MGRNGWKGNPGSRCRRRHLPLAFSSVGGGGEGILEHESGGDRDKSLWEMMPSSWFFEAGRKEGEALIITASHTSFPKERKSGRSIQEKGKSLSEHT